MNAAELAETFADDLLDLIWQEWDFSGNKYRCAYEEELSEEDIAAGRQTVILRTPDGRFYHARITVSVTEQTVRTPTDEQIYEAWEQVQDEKERQAATLQETTGGAS